MANLAWTGPIAGLGNRLLGLASARALAVLLDRRVVFAWSNDEHCPCEYDELFDRDSLLEVVPARELSVPILTAREWDPLVLLDCARATLGMLISYRDFLAGFLESIRDLPIRSDIRARAQQSCTEHRETNVAVHVRRTDRVEHHKRLLSESNPWLAMRATGPVASLCYLLLDRDRLRWIENRKLRRTVSSFARRRPHLRPISYTIYCDSPAELVFVEKTLAELVLDGLNYEPSALSINASWSQAVGSLRETSMVDALVDLLSMANADAIVQNDRSSTFSLAASLIGETRIISSPPKHVFWQEIRRTFPTRPEFGTV